MCNVIINQPDRIADFVARQIGRMYKFHDFTAIGLERNGEIVAGVVYEDYNGVNVFCHIAVDGLLSKKFLWAIHWYPFKQLQVKRVTGCIVSNNYKSLKLAKGLGFKLEAVLDEAHPDGDIYLLCLRSEDSRFSEVYHVQ